VLDRNKVIVDKSTSELSCFLPTMNAVQCLQLKTLELLICCYFNNSSFVSATGNAYQLSQLIRTLLDPENMALGANVRPVCFPTLKRHL